MSTPTVYNQERVRATYVILALGERKCGDVDKIGNRKDGERARTMSRIKEGQRPRGCFIEGGGGGKKLSHKPSKKASGKFNLLKKKD